MSEIDTLKWLKTIIEYQQKIDPKMSVADVITIIDNCTGVNKPDFMKAGE